MAHKSTPANQKNREVTKGSPRKSPLITAPLGHVYLKTATPIIIVMVINGMAPIIDGALLGLFVGKEALTAVSGAFPLFIGLMAFSSWISGGTASIVARQLGADRRDVAGATLWAAVKLALVLAVAVALTYSAVGGAFLNLVSGGDNSLKALTQDYTDPIVYCLFISMYFRVRTYKLRTILLTTKG